MDDWRSSLLAARDAAGIGRRRLAELAGVSTETIRGYEIGRRHPRQESLESILAALGVARGAANAIREAAGFAPIRTGFGGSPTYYYGLEDVVGQVEKASWPQFVADDDFGLVAVNRPLRTLWGIPPVERERARHGRGGMGLFQVLARHDLARHIANWYDVVEVVAGFVKGRPPAPAAEADEDVFDALLVEPFRDRDARFIGRLRAAYESAKPIAPKIRWDYQVVWHGARGGKIRFHGIVTPANEREGLVFNDWIPVDAESWRRFQLATTSKS